MARIGISTEFIRAGRVGGAEQALQYIVDGLMASLGPEDSIVLVGRGLSHTGGPSISLVEPPHAHRVRFVQETLTLRKFGSDLDAYYLPNYFTPPVMRPRVVTTIHDLQYLHLPQNFSLQKRVWLRVAHEATLRLADRVTVVSDFVRDDLLDRYGERWAPKVVTLYNPVAWERLRTARPRSTGAPYVLSVASHYQHKNLATLVRAFRRVHELQPDVELVLVGQLGANLVGVRRCEDVAGLVASLRLGHIVRTTGYIAPDELGALYHDAALFVFPSIFEGFGLPPVEALGFGLPVITTKCASLREVTRGLADYVQDPLDDEELADLIVRRLADGRRPTTADVESLRAFYSPQRLGAELYRLLTEPD